MAKISINVFGEEDAVERSTIEDPAPGFKFLIEESDAIEAWVTECSGLTMEREVLTYAEGGRNDYEIKLPGRTKYQNIVLKRGVTRSDKLWKWYQKGLYNIQVETKNLSIILKNTRGDIVKRWNIRNAYPVKWVGPDLNTGNSQIAFETIELAHHGIELA